MFFKSYKVQNNYIELRFNITKDGEIDIFVQLLKLFELNIGNLLCLCSYDKDIINLALIDGEINVEVVEAKKKFLRTIHLKETNVLIQSIETLKKLLEISNDYDAILVLKSKDEYTETVFVVNDNGHNYIKFNNNMYDKKEIKKKISQILNG